MDPAGWERVLQVLSKLPVEKLVPGHGEIGPTTGIETSLAYVGRVHAVARRIADGRPTDDLLDAQIRAPENSIENVVVDRGARRQREGLHQGGARESAARPDTRADAGPDPREEVRRASSGGSRNPAGARAGRRPDGSLDRPIPPVNVLGPAALGALAAAIEDAPPARLLVLRGLPRAFSAGVEVAAHAPEPDLIEGMLAAMRGVLSALVETPAVTLASVSGACLGGGAELARGLRPRARRGRRAHRLSGDPARVLSSRRSRSPAAARRRGPGGGVDPDGRDVTRAARRRRRDSPRAPSTRTRSRRETERARGARAVGVARRAVGGDSVSCAARPARGARAGVFPRPRTLTGRSREATNLARRSATSRPRAAADSIPRDGDPVSRRPLSSRSRGRHLAARPRVSLRGRDLRGRPLLAGPALPPRGPRRADARGTRRDPHQGLAGLLPRDGPAPARGERPRGQGRVRLRAGLARRGAALPRVPARGHGADCLRLRAGGRPAPAPRRRPGRFS